MLLRAFSWFVGILIVLYVVLHRSPEDFPWKYIPQTIEVSNAIALSWLLLMVLVFVCFAIWRRKKR